MMITARTVKVSAVAVCAVGIIGMIVSSALDHNGAAITFGLVTAVAVLCSMVATSVAASSSAGEVRYPPDRLAGLVEQQIQALVDGGADEESIRQLVGEAVRLGRALGDQTGRMASS
jgi:hypothetical protein